MIRQIVLEKEKFNVLDIKEKKDVLLKRSFSWLRVVNPSDSDLDVLVELFDLSVEDKDDMQFFIKEGGRSRVEKGNALLVVFSVPVIVNKEVETEQILMLAKKNLMVTLEAKKSTVCEKFFSFIEKGKGKYLFKKNSGFFISEFIDETNDRFLRHVNRIEDRIDVLESSGKLLTRQQVEAAASANSTLSFFNQSTLANIEVLNSLRKMYHESLSPENRSAFNDIYHDSLQILDALRLQREAIMNLFNMQSIISGNQMNEFMKKLTVLAIIIAIPTLISSLYGMNVHGLPLADQTYGFWVILGGMVGITLTISLLFFKKKLL